MTRRSGVKREPPACLYQGSQKGGRIALRWAPDVKRGIPGLPVPRSPKRVVNRITCERYCRARARFSSVETKKLPGNTEAPEFGAFAHLKSLFFSVFTSGCGDPTVLNRGSSCIDAVHSGPHPSPLPEGEGTDRVARSNYIDLKYRAELRPLTSHKSAPFPPLPHGGEGWGEGDGS